MKDNHRKILEEIREGDAKSTNGGHYVSTEDREIAEQLVGLGKVVRLKNPAGVTPIYVPIDSDHYSDDRLKRLSERQEDRVD